MIHKIEKLKELLLEVKSLKDLKEQNNTYANALTDKKNKVLVIKPTEKQKSNKIKTNLRQNIDPKTLAFGVENFVAYYPRWR